MTDLAAIDPNETLLRVRQLVRSQNGDVEFLLRLDDVQIMDMLICATSIIHVLESVNPTVVDKLFTKGVDFND